MRILHLADTHLGVENYGRLDPETGLNTRLGDFTACLDEAVNRAVAERVDLVLFAGDAYRSRDPSQTYQREFARRVQRLSEEGIAVFLLVGNHDLPASQGRANSLDIFETLGVHGVSVGRVRRVHLLQTRSGPVQIVAIPWLARNLVLVRDEYKDATPDQLNSLIEESIAHFVDEAIGCLDKSVPTVLAAHMSVLGATYGSERSVMLGQDYCVPWGSLAKGQFAYVALGHIHKHQVLHRRPLTVYSGSIERVDFGEEKEDKGFVLVELGLDGAEHEFVRVNARRFMTLELETQAPSPTESVLDAILRADVQDAVVRVVLKGPAELQQQVDLGEVRRALRAAAYVAAISRDISSVARHSHAGRLVEEMTPLDALDAYLLGKGVAPERQQALRNLAKQVVEGEG